VAGDGNAVVSTITTSTDPDARVTISAAGGSILDDGNAATRITTHDLSLSAQTNIGEITTFASGTGTPIDVAVSGELLLAVVTDVGGEIFLRADDNLTAAAAAINPDADGAATALIVASGNLDVGTADGVVDTANDNLGLVAGGTLTLPAGGYDVGEVAGGALRLRGDVDVQDVDLPDDDHALGPYVADTLEFVSGSAVATTLNTTINELTAQMTADGAALTVNETGTVELVSVTTNNGNITVNAALTASGDIEVSEVDAGTARVVLDVTTMGGQIQDRDDPAANDVDVTGGEVLLLATTGIGRDAADVMMDFDELEINAQTLAARTQTGDIHVVDVAGGLTIGAVNGTNGVEITAGGAGDNVTLTATGAAADLAVNDLIRTGPGAITVTAQDNVTFAATGQIISTGGAVLVEATDGGIDMTDGAVINAGSGVVELQADQNIEIGRVVTTTNVMATSTNGAILDGGDTGGADIAADNLVMSAGTGIGNGNAIDTAVNLLSAENSNSGGISVSNDVGGLLTIGTFGGVVGLMNTGGGAIAVTNNGAMNVDAAVSNPNSSGVSLTATGNDLNVNAQVSTTGADGDITLSAGADLRVNLNGKVVAGTDLSPQGDVELNAGNNLVLGDTGQPNDVVGGTVKGSAGNQVMFGPNVIVQSDTGAVADKLPAVTILIPSQPMDDPQIIAMLPNPEVHLTLGRIGELNLFATAQFDDQTSDAVESIASNTFNGVTIDTTLNGFLVPIGPFTITVTVIDDPNITFFESGVEVALAPSVFTFGQAFETGMVMVPPSAEALPLPTPEPIVAATPATVPPDFQVADPNDVPVPAEAPESGDERIVIVEKIDSHDEIEKDRDGKPIERQYRSEFAERILADPSKLFLRLRSGHFRIWLQDGAGAQRNLIWDVTLRDGVPERGEGAIRPPTEMPRESPEQTLPERTAPEAEMSSLDPQPPAELVADSPEALHVNVSEDPEPTPVSNGALTEDAPSSTDDQPTPAATLDGPPAAGFLPLAALGSPSFPAMLRAAARRGQGVVRRVRSGVTSILQSIAP
jgi:hypothetical protein